MKYTSRSASDKTDEWPFWMVIDNASGLNVAGQLARQVNPDFRPGAVFVSRNDAKTLADLANANLKD